MRTDRENLHLTSLVESVKISLYDDKFNSAPICEEFIKFNEEGFIVFNSGKIFTTVNDVRFEGLTSVDKELIITNAHLYNELGTTIYLFLNDLSKITLNNGKFTDRKFKKDEYGRLSECIYILPYNDRIIVRISYEEDTDLITHISMIEYEELNHTWAFEYNEDNKLETVYLTNEGELVEYWKASYFENKLVEVTVLGEEDVTISRYEYHYSDEGWLNEVLIENDEKMVLMTFEQPNHFDTYEDPNEYGPRRIIKIEERFRKGELMINSLEYHEERYVNGDLWDRKVKICSNVFTEKWSIKHYQLAEIDYLKRKITHQSKDLSQITETNYRSIDKIGANFQEQVTKFDEHGNVVYHAVYENNDTITEVRKVYDNNYRLVLEEGRMKGKLYKYRFHYTDNNNQYSKRAVYRDLLRPVWYSCKCDTLNGNVFRYDTQWPNGKDHSYYFQYDSLGNIIMYRDESNDIDEKHLYFYNDTNHLVRHKVFKNKELFLDELFFFDRKGYQSEKLVKEYKDNKETKFNFKYVYQSFDDKGNWLIREEIDNLNNRNRSIRSIEYRD